MNKIFRPLKVPKDCDKNSTVNPDYYSVVIVQDIAERDRIPVRLRQNGTIAIVVEENYSQYQLKTNNSTGIADNNNWKLLELTEDQAETLMAYIRKSEGLTEQAKTNLQQALTITEQSLAKSVEAAKLIDETKEATKTAIAAGHLANARATLAEEKAVRAEESAQEADRATQEALEAKDSALNSSGIAIEASIEANKRATEAKVQTEKSEQATTLAISATQAANISAAKADAASTPKMAIFSVDPETMLLTESSTYIDNSLDFSLENGKLKLKLK